MKISEIEQETTDFDWYAVDEEGFLAHFTSAGFKCLPASVAADADGLQILNNYFRCAASRGGHKIAADLAARLHRDWKGEQHEARYLRDFVGMADRGLYSFDIETYVKPGLEYFLVATPERPLFVDELPSSVRRILSRTVLKDIMLSKQSSVSYDSTLFL